MQVCWLFVNDGLAISVGALALDSLSAEDLGIESASLWLNEEASDRDENCTDDGDPIKDGVILNSSHEQYAERALYCTSAFNTASPDSALGAMSIMSMFVCELERAQAWTSEDDFTTEGNNVGEVTITITENCAVSSVVDVGLGILNSVT